MDKEYLIPIKFDDIFWEIQTKLLDEKNGDEPIIEMEWGWSAGLTKEELLQISEDDPIGKNGVRILLSQAKRLRNSLDKIIKKCQDG